MKKKEPIVRIPYGNMSCYGETIASILENLITRGFKITDLDCVTIEKEYINYYSESDEPSIVVEWPNIY